MMARAHDRAQGSPLRQRMIEQMRMANLAESTQYSYLYEIERLADHYKASPADLNADQLRAWVLRLIDHGLSPATTNATLSTDILIMSNSQIEPAGKIFRRLFLNIRVELPSCKVPYIRSEQGNSSVNSLFNRDFP